MKLSLSDKKAFTFLCVCTLILYGYSWHQINWAMLAYAAMIPLFLMKQTPVKVSMPLFPVIFLLTLNLVRALCGSASYLSVLQNLFLVLVIFLFVEYQTDGAFFYKCYRRIAIIATLMVYIQAFGVVFLNRYISGALPVGNNKQSVFEKQTRSMGQLTLSRVRPRSLFYEPTMYGLFVGVFLVLFLLSGKKLKKRDWLLGFMLTFGVILSGSSAGILLAGLGWMACFVRQLKTGKITTWHLFLVLITFLAATIYLQTDIAKTFLERTFQSETGGTAGRLAGYVFAFDLKNYTASEFLFGHGVDKTVFPEYMATWPRLLYYFGIFGVLIYLGGIAYFWLRGNRMQRLVLLLLMISSVFFILLYSNDVVFWAALYAASSDKGCDAMFLPLRIRCRHPVPTMDWHGEYCLSDLTK